MLKKNDRIEKKDLKLKELQTVLNLTDVQFEKIKEAMDFLQVKLKEAKFSKANMKTLDNNDKKIAKAKMKVTRAEMQKRNECENKINFNT